RLHGCLPHDVTNWTEQARREWQALRPPWPQCIRSVGGTTLCRRARPGVVLGREPDLLVFPIWAAVARAREPVLGSDPGLFQCFRGAGILFLPRFAGA